MARVLKVAQAGISFARSEGTNSLPQCVLSGRPGRGKAVKATANIDTAPQPYFRVERNTVEGTQMAISLGYPHPLILSGLGVEATWFPAQTKLQSTDDRKIITVTVAWPGASQRRELALAEAIARPYLRTSAKVQCPNFAIYCH
jgi:hypothetical protein